MSYQLHKALASLLEEEGFQVESFRIEGTSPLLRQPTGRLRITITGKPR